MHDVIIYVIFVYIDQNNHESYEKKIFIIREKKSSKVKMSYF
jgi:hypothetical protein